MKIFLQQHQCPGDILMLTSGVRDLKAAVPSISINVETTAQTLWENNPNLDRTVTAGNADRVIRIGYPLIHQSDRLPYHFVHAFRKELELLLGMRIPQGAFRGEVFLSEAEKRALPAVSGLDKYWILDAGHKRDFPLKYWGIENFQRLVDILKGEITFVQIGEMSSGHFHPALRGVVDLRGQTNIRQFCQLMFRAAGVVTPVSFPMHLAAACPTPDGRLRPCIVLGGGREPVTWYQYPGHFVFHTIGALGCCRKGGCWKSRPEDCAAPVTVGGITIGSCMKAITPEAVAAMIRIYNQ